MSNRQLMTTAGVLLSVGAATLLAKGVLLAFTGHDRSLVPWYGLFSASGLTVASVALWRSVERWRWIALVGGLGAAAGVVASVVAASYLIAGTIPESADAPPVVGLSYGVMSGAVFLGVFVLGMLIAGNRSLVGRWRWFPVGVVLVQLPIFILAGAIGDGVGSEDLTDGLGLALSGAVWLLLGYAISGKQRPEATMNSA